VLHGPTMKATEYVRTALPELAHGLVVVTLFPSLNLLLSCRLCLSLSRAKAALANQR